MEDEAYQYCRENNISSRNIMYTNYIQSAKSFDKETANKQAAILRNKSKTGKYWGIQRIIVG